MFSVQEAESCILQHCLHYNTESVLLNESIGRILAEDILADRPAPPYDRVAMDGIAILRSTCQNGIASPCEGIARAGIPQINKTWTSSYLEVSTGAMLPKNTDAVIPYEDLLINNNTASWIKEIPAFLNVHKKGTDYKTDEILLKKGKRITLQDISLLAALGKNTLTVTVSPRIALITTGDEVVPITNSTLTHQIRNSNSIQIHLLLQAHGFTNVTAYHSTDKTEDFLELITTLADQYDILVCIGGISKGTFDVVRDAIQKLTITPYIDGIAQRPGKPFFFGLLNTIPFFALPGNPLSAIVTARRYLVPFLYSCAGTTLSPIHRTLGKEYSFTKPLTKFLFVKQDTMTSNLVPIPESSSGNFFSLVNSIGFLELPPEQDTFYSGDEYIFYPWNDM